MKLKNLECIEIICDKYELLEPEYCKFDYLTTIKLKCKIPDAQAEAGKQLKLLPRCFADEKYYSANCKNCSYSHTFENCILKLETLL